MYFSFRKSHHPKKLSKRSLTILYLENSSALSFAFESPNDLNWFFDWSASSAFICLHSYKLVTSFPNLETDMFFFWIIFKGIRQTAFLTKLKFNGDFSLSFFKIWFNDKLKSFNKFFFWRLSGFAALRVDSDAVGSLMDKIESRVSLFVSIAKSDPGPLPPLQTFAQSFWAIRNKSFAIHLKQTRSLACLFGISEIRQTKTY